MRGGSPPSLGMRRVEGRRDRLMQEFRGSPQGEGLRIGLVVARFNQFITRRLLDGALEALRLHGVREEDIAVAWVPGSFELPLVAQRMARSDQYQAVVCLGAVIRGETPHFDYIAAEAAKGVSSAAMTTGVPVIFGVLTTNTTEQAVDRAGGKMGNKGYDAALAALEMASVLHLVQAPAPETSDGWRS